MSEKQWFEWCNNLNLSNEGQAIIERIRSSPPSRVVGNRRGNVKGRYPSKKMGVTIQFESHKNELPAIYEMEHTDNVLEYYDQPPPIKLNYLSKTGRKLGVIHTPDFFVIRRESAGWEEWKYEDELNQLEVDSPNRYVKDDEGRWRCPPGEKYAEQFGLYYRIRSSSEIHWVYQRNIRFLEDYFRMDNPIVSAEVTELILSHVMQEPGMKLEDLLFFDEKVVADDIYMLIVTGQIFADIYSSPLEEPENVYVFINQETAKAYSLMTVNTSRALLSLNTINIAPASPVVWDGRLWTIANVGESAIALLSEDGNIVNLLNNEFGALVSQGKIFGPSNNNQNDDNSLEIRNRLVRASEEDLKEANYRYHIIAPILNGKDAEDTEHSVSPRTIRHWKALYKETEQLLGCGYIGLLPRYRDRGNRNRKLPESTLDLMKQSIEDDYETIRQMGKRHVHGMLLNKCEELGIIAPSYDKFVQEVNNRPKYEQTLKRKGHRAANKHEPFYWEPDLTTPRHGSRPWELAHIDHTEMDIELIHLKTFRNLGRPWVTFLSDANTRRLLAIYITFDPPSYRSCMMVLRECVRRHGRLPETIVVDGGKEFSSTYFETMLARYKVLKKDRPSAKPRFGNVIERLFGTSNTQFVHNLLGNTQITKDVRITTKAVNPKGHAVWTLDKFYEKLCEWGYEIYDTIEHPALGQSPRDAFLLGIKRSGKRPYRLIQYDENFRIFTLPSTRKGTAKVQIGCGVKINYFYYWCEAFRDPGVENTQVPVRYDPFDISIGYAFVQGQWVQCQSEYFAILQGRSEKEIKVITDELKQRRRMHGKSFNITAKRIAEFLRSCGIEENKVLELRRIHDSENKQILKVIEGGRINASKPQTHQQEAVQSQNRLMTNIRKNLKKFEEI